jgi:hypothetical protein
LNNNTRWNKEVSYYDEHIAVAVIRRKVDVPSGTIKPVQVTTKKFSAEPDDKETYTGNRSIIRSGPG